MRTIDSFTAAVHRKRREHGWTLGEVAARAGYSASYLSKLLHGHRALLPAVVRDLDKALAAEGELEKIAAAQRGDTGPANRPMQLPPAASDFVGRETQLRAMDHALVAQGWPGSTATIIIEGGFWTGKTALAVHWASSMQARFPSGCLFADLRGLAPGTPADPQEVLDGFLLALGVRPAELDAATPPVRIARYRSLLAERPAVVVLDNVTNHQQTEWLLPGTGSVVLATSRKHQPGLLARTGGTLVQLPPLAADEAFELLGRRAGDARVRANAAAAEHVVEHCGRLPMTIRIVAEHLRHHRDTSLTDLAERLGSVHTCLDLFTSSDPAVNLHDVVDRSYLALPPMARRVFRYLGIGPVTVVGPESVAVLTGLDIERAQEALRLLAAANLLEPAPDGRCRISHLLRAYARQHALATELTSEIETAHDRTLQWYTATAWTSNNTLAPDWADNANVPQNPAGNDSTQTGHTRFTTAMAWCEREATTALQAARTARRRNANDDTAWLLPTAFLPYFALTRNWNTWLIAAHDSLAAARAADNNTGIARSLLALGWVEHELGRTDQGIEHLEDALRLHETLGDDRSRAWNAYSLGLAYTSRGRITDAREAHQLADRLFTDAGVDIGVVVNRAALANACDLDGDKDQAITYALDVLDRAQASGSTAVLGIAHQRIGVLLARHDQHRKALQHFDEALAARNRPWQRWCTAETLISRAEALRHLDQTEQARETYLRSLDILDSLRDPRAPEVRTRLASMDAETPATASKCQ